MQLHLDKEYRQRYQLFYLEDGTVEDSREKNWRDVAWDKVERIMIIVREKKYEFYHKDKPGFKGYMNLRFKSGTVKIRPGQKPEGKITNSWAVGWTDGEKVYLEEFDFFTGDKLGECIDPIEERIKHVHPAIVNRFDA
jgi:hypothetical protein